MSGKINVLFIHSQNGFGADSAIHAHLIRHLDRRRFVVHVACSRGDGSGLPAATVKFQSIPDIRFLPTHFAPGFHHRGADTIVREARAALSFPLEFTKLLRYIRRQGIDIIHGTDRPRDAVYSLVLGRLTGAKSVVHVHVAWSHGYSAPARWGVSHADGVFSISKFVTETIVATGTPRERVHTVLNGIEPASWDPSTDGGGVRREFGVPPGAPLLVSVSRLFRQKGQRELLQALAIVRSEVPEVRLLIVGADEVHVHRGSFTAELTALAQELGLSDRVVFTGHRADIRQIMAACDVYTMPSFEEPFGLVFLEAMAMGKPVVGIGNGGTPEVVEDGRSGLLAPASDVAALARHIVKLLKDADLRARMGAYGRSRVLEYFNAERMAADAARAYERLLVGRGAFK